MADFTIKQNDTWPPLVAILSNQDGPIDLTTAAQVKMYLRGTTVTINGTCSITNAAAGEVTYTWAVGDLAVNGNYDGEFEITWASGKKETVPNDGYFSFTILDDLA